MDGRWAVQQVCRLDLELWRCLGLGPVFGADCFIAALMGTAGGAARPRGRPDRNSVLNPCSPRLNWHLWAARRTLYPWTGFVPTKSNAASSVVPPTPTRSET